MYGNCGWKKKPKQQQQKNGVQGFEDEHHGRWPFLTSE